MIKVRISADPDSVVREAAAMIAAEARAAIAARGGFAMAVSGGRTPWVMLRAGPALNVAEADVSLTAIYQGRRRMTLTYPILNRSRQVLWLVTGHDKAEMVRRLYAGDASIPAGRIHRDHALVLADRAAAGQVYSDSKIEIDKE